ncbi:zinc finger CCHC domain-containing protein 9-like [Oppia nitens]|uniref:zinc finger CCHC domain-containing protein 9-like n=1 Tax=Oppia nitens TaxID=1686743 RepID=UPI0023DC9FA9|nr:zinc finger CCHC domain-containing protein 9-like [Oppia nitens]
MMKKRKSNTFIITDMTDNECHNKVVNEELKQMTEKPNVEKSLQKPNKSQKTKKRQSGDQSLDIKQTENSRLEKPFKINKFWEKCMEKRKEKGFTILPQKIETKIYLMKKALRRKNLSEDEIRDIVRKRRRDEEMKFAKNSKVCFKCRRSGHMVAECPQNNSPDVINICYRCGSTEHNLSECRQSGEHLPYAMCFKCKETGHISRDCPQNERGIYPKGGSCKACGSVNHLIKDCPMNEKDKKLEQEITLSTLDTHQSLDADLLDVKPLDIKMEKKKVVSF